MRFVVEKKVIINVIFMFFNVLMYFWFFNKCMSLEDEIRDFGYWDMLFGEDYVYVLWY